MADNNNLKITKRVLDFSPASFNTGMEGSQYKRDLSPFEKSQDVLANSQGFWDASGNFLANIVGSTAINTAGLGASLYGVSKAIGTGEFKNIWDNELSQGLDKVQKGLDEITPFYNSEKEDKANLFSKDYLTSAGFWGNTVGKGVSFIAGAYLGGAGLAKGGSMALKGMSRASKSFGKLVNGEEATSGLISAAKQGNIPGWIERAGKSSTIRNASSYYAQKISGNMFEAGMEAKGVKEEILRGKEEEYAKLHPSAPVAPDWLKKEWDEDSNTFGNVAFGLNMLLLQIDGIGLGKTMYGYKTTKRTIEAAKDAAGKYVELSAKRKMLNKAGRIIGGGLEEAAQEGGQFIVEKSSTELGVNDKAKNFADYVNAGFKGLEQTLGTKEGQESMLAGLLLGGGGRGIGELRGAAERNLQNKVGIEALNKYMLKDTIKPLVDLAGKSFDDGTGQILENATEVNDKKLFQDTKAKDFFNWASTRIEMGRYEDAVEEIEQLKNSPIDILDGVFPNHGLTESKKHQMFNGLLSDMKELNSMQSDVEINFGNSPYKKNILNTAYRIKNIDRRIQEMSVKEKGMLDIYHDEDLQNLLAEKEELSRDLAILMMTKPKPPTNTQEEKTSEDNTDANKALAPSNTTPTETPDDIVSKQEKKENIVGTKIPGMGVITNISNGVATIKDSQGNITHEELDNLPNEAFEEKIFTPEPSEDDEESRMLPDYADPDTKKKDVSFVDPSVNTEDTNYRFGGKEEFVQASDFGILNYDKIPFDKVPEALSFADSALIPKLEAFKQMFMDKKFAFENFEFDYSKDDSTGHTSVLMRDKNTGKHIKIGHIPNINTQLAGNAKDGSKRSILDFMRDYFTGLKGTNRLKNKNSFIPVIQGIRSLLEKSGLNITPYIRLHSKIKPGTTQLNEVLQSPRFLVNGNLAMSFFKDGIYQPDPNLPKELQDTIKKELEKPYNQNNLGTQYALMVERPGQPGVYTFIGVKGRKLTADEKQAYAARIAGDPQGVVKLLNKELFISSERDQIQGNDGNTYPLHYEFDRYEERNDNGEVTKAGKIYVKRFIKGTIDNAPIKDKRRSTISVQEALDRAAVRTAPTVDEAFTPENLAKLQLNTDKELFDLYFQFDAKKFVAEHPLEFNQGDIINKAQQEADEKKRIEQEKLQNATGKINIISTSSADIIADLNKLSTFQEKLEWLKSNNLLEPININGKNYNVVDYNDELYNIKPQQPTEDNRLTVNVAKQIETALLDNIDIDNIVDRVKDAKEIIAAFDWALKSFPESVINEFVKGSIPARDQLLSQVRSFIKQNEQPVTQEPEVIIIGKAKIIKNADGTYTVLDEKDEVMLERGTLEKANQAAENINSFDDFFGEGNTQGNEDLDKLKLLKEIEETAPEEKEKILREVAVFENELARILPGIKVNIDFTKGHSYYRNAVITLTSGQVSSAKWHEAFHAIFDCFNPEEKNRAIRIAAENFAIDPAELLMYRNFYDELYEKNLALFQSKQISKEPKKLTEEELIKIMYEEKIADLFQDYMENRPVERGLFQRFFDAIAKFIMHLLGRTDEAPFTSLFNSINRGDFSNRNPNLGEENIKMKLPNSSSSQSRQLVANIGVQTIHELRDNPKTDVSIFIKGQIEKYRTMYSTNVSTKVTDLKKKLASESITKDQVIEQVRILTNTRQIIDINNLYPPMLAAENESLIIDAVKKFSNLIDKYEVELQENDEDNTETIKNLSLMESNMDELIEAQAVQQRISYLHYLDENGMVTAVDGKALYDNLKMNLEGLENEQFIPTLEKLAGSKKETPYTKSMKEFLKLFKADQTFRTQCYNAFSNYFVPSYSSKIDTAGTVINKNTGEPTKGFESNVYANNAENYVETQMDTWKSQLFGKTLERIESPEDLLKYITIQDELFDSPTGIPLITSLINSINNKLGTRTSVDIINMITTGKDNITLQKLAAENIIYRTDLGDLTYKFGGKNFYSMLKQNYVFKQLKNSEKYKNNWGVFTGVNFRLKTDSKAEQELYKEIDPATYFLTNLQLYSNGWYIPQQMENKSTVVIVKGDGKINDDLSPAVTEEITRQTALIDRYTKELKSGKSLIEGFHTYDKVSAEIENLKGFKNTPEFILSLIEKGTKRNLLPRAYQYINIVGANETLSNQKLNYNESKTLDFIANEVLGIKDIITELGLPNDILGKIFGVDIKNQEAVEDALNKFAISQYLNRMEMLATINPELTKYKNFVDITKRGAGLLLAGPSHYNADRPATFGTVVLDDVVYKINPDTMERAEKGQKIKATDGQSIETIGRRMDRHLRLGRASEDPNNDFYKKAEILQAYKDDDRAKIAELDSGDMALMVDKTGGFDGKKYIKTSIFPLTRYFTSYQVPAGTEGAVVDTYNGKSYLPYPHRIESHNQLGKLQALEVEVTNTKRASGEIKKNQNIYFEAHFASAIKLGLTNINPLDAEKYEYSEYNNADYRLQQENPSGKDEIKDGTQLIQLIGAFLPNDIQFSGDFKEYIGPNARQEILKDMSKMLADLRTFDRKMIPNAFRKLQLLGEKNGGIYVPFIKYLQDSKESSSGSDNDSEFLASKDGEFIYSQNMPHLVNGYEQAFISYFNKNLFSQKTPGGKATLVAATYSEVMEFNGEVISTWEFENKLTAKERTQVTSRPLKCHKPGGNVEDAYAEVVLSEEYLEDILGITFEEYHNLATEMKEKVKTILGFRIPTQSHHSMMPCKVVDFAPRHYGSIVIAPAEITYLSGADYDVDSLFYQRYSFYKNADDNLAKVQLDTNTYFSTIMNNKIVKDYMKMNSPELDEIKVDIAKKKAATKAYKIKLREYEINPPSNLNLIKGVRESLNKNNIDLKTKKKELHEKSRKALTTILKALEFPTTEAEFEALENKNAFIKDYTNNSLLSTRLNILTSSFDGKFAPAVDKFQELYDSKNVSSKYLPKVNKDGEIYTSIVTFFRHYLNNYAGGRAIGASANGNKVFANLHATNSTLSVTLKRDLVKSINRELFTDTNSMTGVDFKFIEVNGKLRFSEKEYSDFKSDNLSSAVSMTVDNVKEQTLVKFNLNDKTMPLLTSAFGIGIGNNVMATFLLNPITKLFSQTFMKQSSPFGEKGVTMRDVIAEMQEANPRTKEEKRYQINKNNLNDFLEDATEDSARKLDVLTKFINGDLKLENINTQDRSFIQRQFALLDLYSTIAEIAEDSFVINTLLNLNKELGEQASDADYVISRYNKAERGDKPDGMPPSRFSFNYNMTSAVKANVMSVYTAKEILDDNLLFYGKGMEEVFRNIEGVCLTTPTSKSDFENRVEMKKEFLNFLIIRAYSKFNRSSMDINNFDLVKGGLVKMYEENKDAIIKYPFGQMLKPLAPTRQYPFGRLGVDSFKKLDPRKKDDIMDSFAGMLIDPQTKEFAVSLLSFIATHDNFRFLGQSTVSFMRPSIFNALNEVVKGTDSLDGVEDYFIKYKDGKLLDTQKMGQQLITDGSFSNFFNDYLSFWFSDGRNANKLDKTFSKVLNTKTKDFYIETKDIKDIPLVTFFSTEEGRVPVILNYVLQGKAYYKVIRKPKTGTSLKFYQLTNDESVDFINSASKTLTPDADNTKNIINAISKVNNIQGLNGYLELLKTKYDTLNDNIINALNSKRATLGAVQSQPAITVVDNTNKPEFNKLPNKSATPTMTYAGIGSRGTPQEILELMTKAAEYLDGIGYTLQTGFTFKDKETGLDEEGADKAFSDGSKNKILFGPYGIRNTVKNSTSLENYDNNVSKISDVIVKEIHPAPDRLTSGALKLMARNANQIFGKNLNSTVDFVLFYAEETNNPLRPKGGTGQAVEMARRKDIPTINMADSNWRDQLKAAISKKSTQTSTNVKPTIDTSREWSGDLKTRPVYTAEGVNTMRTEAATPNEHFGNPFSEAGYGNTIKVNSIPDAVLAYKDWLLNGVTLVKTTNKVDLNTYLKPFESQRTWILNQINQGKLDGATLLYAGKLEARGQGIHPTALAEVVEQLRSTQPSSVNKVLEGDIFELPGIPVITTNLGGVHGAGLAQAAKTRGLITQGNGEFKATTRVVQLPVKKVWSDSMAMNNNMELLKESLRNLIKVARAHKDKTFLLPLAGLGHGEGSVEEILPLLIATVQASPNINLVIPTENVNLGREGTVRKDYTRENMPKIKQMLNEAGLLISTTLIEDQTGTTNDDNLPNDRPYVASEQDIKDAINPFGDAKFKLNRSLFGLPEPQDAGPKQVNVDAVNIVINKIKSNFALYKDILGIENVEQLDNMNTAEIAALINKICKS